MKSSFNSRYQRYQFSGSAHRLANIARRRVQQSQIANALQPLESRVLLAAYTVVDLGSLGDETVLAANLTNSGIATGHADTASATPGESVTHVFLAKNGQMTDLDKADPKSSGASVNESAQVVGFFGPQNGNGTPALFANGTITPLNDLLPKNSPWSIYGVISINDNGTALTWVVPKGASTSSTHLAMFNVNTGQLTDLGKFTPSSRGGTKLNSAGDVVATTEDSNHVQHAYLFSTGAASEIAPNSGGDVIARDINDAGEIVGERLSQPFVSHAGQVTDLDTGVFSGGEAIAINNHGDIVGNLFGHDTQQQPFIYSHGQMQLLNSLIPGKAMTIVSASDINDSGEILVNGVLDNDSPHFLQQHAYILIPNASTSTQDDVRPLASMQNPPSITVGGAKTYTFSVHYTDNVAIAPGSIVAGGLRISSDKGFVAKDISVVSQTPDANGHGVTVAYSLGARGGYWNPADNGAYYVSTTWQGVTDTSGNLAGPPVPLGQFNVDIASSTTDFGAATQSDMVEDANGTLHVAYYDSNDQVLKYITRSAGGVWSAASVIDSAAGAGQFISIALDANGHPGVAYYAGGTADLKYAHFDGTNWSTDTVDSYHSTGGFPSLVYDANGLPAIAYWRKASGDLRLARFDGATWTIQTLDEAGNTGRFPSLKLDPNTHRLALAWEDHDGGAFKYASENADGTFATTIVDSTTSEGGGYVSLAFSPVTGNPAFSYYDAGKGDLKFAAYSGGAWQIAHLGDKSTIGLYSHLTFNQDGLATIFAYDRSGDALFRAWSPTSSPILRAKMLHLDGGRSLDMLPTGGAGDTTLAFLDKNLTNLHVEEYVGI